MPTNQDFAHKSTVDQIRTRFDNDVERFSNLQTGQQVLPDAPLVLEIVPTVAAQVTPNATDLLDVGCGAGNFSLKILERLPGLNVQLVDLSQPMLDRAHQRVSQVAGVGRVRTHQADIRELPLAPHSVDLIVAGSVLHHLRGDEEWQAVFANFYQAVRPDGSIWISDLIEHSTAAVQTAMWQRYGDYLVGLKNETLRDDVFSYIDMEDTPRPLMFQIDLLREVGFDDVEILHKNSCFAVFGAIKK